MALLSRNSNSGLRGQSVAGMRAQVKGQHLSRSEGICPVMRVSVLFTGACARTLLRLVPVNRIHSRASSWMDPSVVFGRRRSSTASAIVAPCAPPVRVRSGVSAPSEPEYKEERERKRRVSALPDSGSAVMVMIVRGGAECGSRVAEKCGLKGQVGARPCMCTATLQMGSCVYAAAFASPCEWHSACLFDLLTMFWHLFQPAKQGSLICNRPCVSCHRGPTEP
ncbi:hypothetical protein D4764_10G0006150 [Takifugu flavidus]|uniref:Uncharacterized protein n=1 Tax=Takifugu flavidus TaxID=433684 RepID=A0A5C6PJL2_9TELE|nr:hypothetical protein D4764_10G0006150 [Takifugu flavidus]